MMTIWNK